jgi:ubiquinone/menaquinone biosynthesis C-methylase UbiE
MKPVNKEEFWKERLEQAHKNGDVRYSVFIANQSQWDSINQKHQSIITKEIKETDNVLDAGCGYGRLSESIKNYTGVDLSPDLIEEAKRLYPDKKFLVSKLESLPFLDNEFDVSVCISIKAMIVANLGEESWLKMLKELKRVSKKVLILEYGIGDANCVDNAEIYEIL